MQRSHAEIIRSGDGTVEGVTAFARAINVPPNRVYPWERIDSIPGPYWKAVVLAELATFSELAEAAEKRRPEISAPESCAA